MAFTIHVITFGALVVCASTFHNGDVDSGSGTLMGIPYERRQLTSEEVKLADEARHEIASTLEANLIKFFTLVAATGSENSREIFGRQEDYDEDTTLNPNTLPQVAQILGAIFAGNLNLTSIVDKTFVLVPGVLRNQVEGLFKFLTGGFYGATTEATTAKARPIRSKATTAKPKTLTSTEKVATAITNEAAVKEAVAGGTKKRRGVYRIKNRPSAKKGAEEDDDDKLLRLEEEVINAAIDAEPFVRDKQPRFFVAPLREIVNNFDNGRLNVTQIIKFLPDLFQGARHAFTLLENLGEIADVDLDDD